MSFAASIKEMLWRELETAQRELPRRFETLKPLILKLEMLGRTGINYAYPHYVTAKEELEKLHVELTPYHPNEVDYFRKIRP